MSDKNFSEVCKQIRRDIVRMVHAAQSGHPGGSLGCTELFVALFFNQMKYSLPFDEEGKNEDVFFLSNGHISPVYYSTLARSGFFDIEELKTFRQINSRLQGHPATEEGLPGIRVASGSLGQGLSVAIGTALTKKMNQDPHTVYCLMGDGEQQEGQIWEAVLFAASHHVDNLIAFIDWNGQQIDGSTREVNDLGDLQAKYKAFGWHVSTCDGNDFQALNKEIEAAKKEKNKGKPLVIMMKTEMGKGVDFMEGTHKWHGIPPNDDELQRALTQIGETQLGDY